MTSNKIIGFASIAFGILIIVFSRFIVFPGLEMMLGIETLVGRENVNYRPDGSYMYTNPGAMAAWILTVSGIGLLIAVVGSMILIRNKPTSHSWSHNEASSSKPFSSRSIPN